VTAPDTSQVRAPAAQSVGARISRILAAADEATLGTAVETCLEELGRYTDVDLAYVVLVDDEERIHDLWGWTRPGQPEHRPTLGTPLGEVFGSSTGFLRLGKTLAIDDVRTIDVSPAERELANANGGLVASVMVPVMLGADFLGLVGLQSSQEPRHWNRETIGEIEVFADLLVRLSTRTLQRSALAVANARARRIAEHIPDGLLMLTSSGTVSWASPSLLMMAEVLAKEIEGLMAVELVCPADRSDFDSQLAQLGHAGDTASVTVRIRAAEGQWRWADLSLRLASDPDLGVPDEIVVIVHDTHERHVRETRLARESDLDPLTGLANRGAFDRFVEQVSASDGDILVAFCDVDDFKRFNDELGHDAGDDILRRVARAIEVAVRTGDVAARIGGDEFALILLGVENEAEASSLAARLVESVRSIEPLEGPRLTISVGVCGPGPAVEAPRMLRKADEAMYTAKHAGKDGWARNDWSPTG
jgi:diguanylate cyclase (GGDEF)-like protein/PAS domain S-box-containing protein